MNSRQQQGQAMTEFVITAAYLLVPLFVIVPLLTKYIDIKHATINAARYQAWEYTVWHDAGDDHFIFDNFTAAKEPIKAKATTEAETSRRFFSRIQQEQGSLEPVQITSKDAGISWATTDANPLWTDHRGKYLVDTPASGSISTANMTPGYSIGGINIPSIISTLTSAFGTITNVVGNVLSSIGKFFNIPINTKFSAINMKGYTKVDYSLPVNTRVDPLDADSASILSSGKDVVLNFNSKAGVLAEGWNAGGFDHTYEQVAGLVFTNLFKQIFKIPGLSWVFAAAEFMAPELTSCLSGGKFSLAKTLGLIPKDGSLWLGYVDSDTVHPDRLSGGGVHVCDAAGRCRLQPNIPQSHVTCIP